MSKHKVFVYGTLRKGFHNNYLLSTSKMIGNAETIDKYTLVAAGIPFVNSTKETSTIKGEVYEVSDNVLATLDRLEGYNENSNNNWYERKLINVSIDGNLDEAFIYFNDNESGVLIESGDYKDYK